MPARLGKGSLRAGKGHDAWASRARPRLRVPVCMGMVVGTSSCDEWMAKNGEVRGELVALVN